MLSSRVLLALACAILSLAGTCTAFISTIELTGNLPYSYADSSRGTFKHAFRGTTSSPSDKAFVFINDADSMTFDVASNAPTSIFSTYQARFNASYYFIPLRFHQSSSDVPSFGLRDTVHMEHMVNDLHVLLTEQEVLKNINQIILVGTGRGGAVAAHYRALYASLNKRVLGALVDTPTMKKATTSLIYSFPTGAPEDCTSAIAAAVKDIDAGLRADTTGEYGKDLATKLNLCSAPPIGMSAPERAFFWYQISYPFARYMNSPHSMFGNTPRSVDALCKRITMANYLPEFITASKAMRMTSTCVDIDMNSALTTGPKLDMYQGTELAYSCSGGLAIPTTSGITSIYAPDAVSKDLYDDLCRLYLGPKFNIATAAAAADRIERNLNMNKPYAGSKVFFVHSTLDALSNLGDIYPVPQPANTVVQSKTIRGFAFRSPSTADSAELREIKRKIAAYVDDIFIQ